MKSDGPINYASALVGRDGRYWARNIPLTGSSTLYITVTDPAGNATTTSAAAAKGASPSFFIYPVGPADTNAIAANPPCGPVTINGVSATDIYGDGTIKIKGSNHKDKGVKP
jgi:hypothetical protein